MATVQHPDSEQTVREALPAIRAQILSVEEVWRIFRLHTGAVTALAKRLNKTPSTVSRTLTAKTTSAPVLAAARVMALALLDADRRAAEQSALEERAKEATEAEIRKFREG